MGGFCYLFLISVHAGARCLNILRAGFEQRSYKFSIENLVSWCPDKTFWRKSFSRGRNSCPAHLLHEDIEAFSFYNWFPSPNVAWFFAPCPILFGSEKKGAFRMTRSHRSRTVVSTDTEMTEEDWETIFSRSWSEEYRLALEAIRENGNKPTSAEQLRRKAPDVPRQKERQNQRCSKTEGYPILRS